MIEDSVKNVDENMHHMKFCFDEIIIEREILIFINKLIVKLFNCFFLV